MKKLIAVAMVAACAVAQAATTGNYVQDGLIAMWDGWENAGAGQHATELTEWKDTSGRYSFKFNTDSGITLGDASLVFSGATGCWAELSADDTANTFDLAKDGTLEIVFKADSDIPSGSMLLHAPASSGITFARYSTVNGKMRWVVSYKLAPQLLFNADSERVTASVHYSNCVASEPYLNGKLCETTNQNTGWTPGSTTTLGSAAGKTMLFKGEVCAIRLYSGSLTAEQIGLNRDVDYERFVCGDFAPALPVVKIQNFDDDLATVYVNGEPTTNGQRVAVDGSTTIELKDFRNDYYFRFAPASRTDRSLALDFWEGVPAGCERSNPAQFPVDHSIVVTPNVDVKGYCWEYQEVGDVKQLTNDVYRWAWVKWVDANRTVLFGPCIEPVVPATENNLVVDFIERVRCNGKNYQVSTFSLANRVFAFTNSRAGTWAVPPRFSSFGINLMMDSGSSTFCITNVVGFYDIESCVVGDAPFSHAGAAFNGPATNFVPRNATSFGSYPYNGKSGMTGEVLMEKVTSIGSKCFYGCSGLTSLRITSPNLSSIGNIAFAGCSKMKEVTFAGSLANLKSIDASAFQSVVVTNFNFLVAPPASKTPLDNMLAQTTAGDGAHVCRLTVDSSIAAWWALTAAPTEAELGVGLPENFMGVYVSDAGDRRAWIVSSTPVGGILLVGDMSMEGNAGFVPRTGLEIGSKLELKAPDGYDQCQLQHFVDGQWRTDKTISGTTVDYEHDGQLTRAVWSVDGAKLTKKVNGYGGAIDVTVVSGKEISEGIYEKGSVVRLTASGAAEHPTSHFAGWTKGIDAAQAGTATVEVTLDTDVEVTADFSPDEWIYTKSNATSGTLTDGEWTMTATKTDGELTINSASGGQNGVLWLDLALPVHDSENMEANYPITVLNCSPVNMRKMRVAPHFRAITAGPFMPNSTVLERIDGLGASQMTSFGYAFLYECGKCPLRTTVYEANDFVPPGLLTVISSLSGVPYLTGTYELNAVTCLYKVGSINFQLLNDRLYYGTVDGHVVGVTNILLTTEGLQEIPDGIFGNARVEAVTIGSTNLTTTGTSAFKNYNGAFRSLTFLAHAPTVAALDNLVKVAATTNLTVYCSKFAPGWKDLRTKGYSTMEEWAARPAGCWGIYQTADCKKRYYLVQKDSKYDKRNGFAVILK